MSKNIHPKTQNVEITCGGCNNSFVINSTYSEQALRVELCHLCHPAYTGKRKISRAGKIKRFEDRFKSRNTKMVSKTGSEESQKS